MRSNRRIIKELILGTLGACWGFLTVFEPPPSKAKSDHPYVISGLKHVKLFAVREE
jgi:hypothetical protein